MTAKISFIFTALLLSVMISRISAGRMLMELNRNELCCISCVPYASYADQQDVEQMRQQEQQQQQQQLEQYQQQQWLAVQDGAHQQPYKYQHEQQQQPNAKTLPFQEKPSPDKDTYVMLSPIWCKILHILNELKPCKLM